MTNPLRTSIGALRASSDRAEAAGDYRRARSFRLAAGSLAAAEAKSYPTPQPRLRVFVDSAGLPLTSNNKSQLTRAITEATAMLAAYRSRSATDVLPTQLHYTYRDKYPLISMGDIGNMIEFGFRAFNPADDELFDTSSIETITQAAVRDLVELLPVSPNDDDALDSVLSLPVTQRVGLEYLVKAVRSTSLGVSFALADDRGQLSTAQAAILGDALTEERTTRRDIQVEAILDGVRTRRRIFYLEAEHDYHGSVDEEILPQLPRYMGQTVRVVLEESTVRHASGRSGRPTYRLKSINGDTPLF